MNPAEIPAPNAQRNVPIKTGVARIKSRLSLAGFVLGAISGLIVPRAYSQSAYTFSTMAGLGGKPGYLDGTGGGIGFPLFNAPTGVVLNKNGNLYVTDSGNQLIREVTPAGAVTTFAGTVGQAGIQDGTGISAGLNASQGPALDSAGNLYVADYNSATIRKITPAGVVTTIAGLALTSGSTNATGTAALFFKPSGVTVDSSGNVFVADSGNNMIRKITSAGVVTTVAGVAGVFGSQDTDSSASTLVPLFYNPRAVVVDSSGNLYVADTSNNAIRRISSAGVVSTLAGKTGTFGATDGVGSAARFNFPNGLALQGDDTLYVADELNHVVRKIVISTATVSTVAGLAGTTGKLDGTGTAARFNHPSGVTVDASGTIYVADYNNNLIRKISSTGVVTTVAGVATMAGALDGLGYNLTPVLFNNPSGTAVDTAGNVFVADTANNMIRKITAIGAVSTFVGNINLLGYADGTGSTASFNSPSGLAIDAAGNIFVADTANHLIREVTAAGVVTTIAGTATVAGSADGVGTAATFNLPSSVAVDAGGNVYVADYNNHTIRKIAVGGVVSTFAGAAGSAGSADGVGGAARFNFPRGVAVDIAGNVYVADSGNDTIRKISPAGLVLTLAGSAGAAGTTDGTGSGARFSSPTGLTVDSAYNVFVTDANNSTIRQITLGGVVTTVGGAGGSASNVDGAGAVARFDHPGGLSIDALGNLYIADSRNHTIRKGFTAASGGGGTGTGGTGTGGTGTTGGTGGTGTGGTGGNGSTGGTGGTTGTGTGFVTRPSGLALNIAGGFLVADTANNSIKAVATDGTVTVLAGKDGTAGSTNGTGTAASFNGPTGMIADSSGNVYVCDTGNAIIRKITPAGVVTTLAGSAGTRGSQDGTGSAAQFSKPVGIAQDSFGNLYVADSDNSTIRKVTLDGIVTTFAGATKSVGDVDGLGTAARFNNPTGLAINTGTNILYIADTFNDTIRAINTADITTSTTVTNADGTTTTSTSVATPAGTVKTIAGSPGISGAFDGVGAFALFNLPNGLSVDSSSNVFVADTGNNCLRRVTGAGVVTTIAGLAGISGNRDGTATSALFNQPQALLYASTILVADTGNSVIRSVSASTQAVVSTVALKAPTTTTTTPTTSSGGGGGSMDPRFLTALLVLFGYGCVRKRATRSLQN